MANKGKTKYLGDRIRHFRLLKGMTQKQLADILFTSDKVISKWEMNKSIPDVDILLDMSDIFDVSIEHLLTGKENKTKVKGGQVIYKEDGSIDHYVGEDGDRLFTRSEVTIVLRKRLERKQKQILDTYGVQSFNELENIVKTYNYFKESLLEYKKLGFDKTINEMLKEDDHNELLYEEVNKPSKMDIKVIYMDITKIGEKADVIVNAANESLLGGGGVDGAIHFAAGPELLEECKTLNGCKPGQAKVTKAYKLKNKHIIHTVGPRYYSDPNPAETLTNCYLNCLKLADDLGMESIAFPSISTGAFAYPIKEAAEICAKVLCNYKPKHLKQAYICIFEQEYGFDAYNEAIQKALNKKQWQHSIYAAYHDLTVHALMDSEGRPHFRKKINMNVCTYILLSDEIPKGLRAKEMKFSDFYQYVVMNGYEYLNYYYDSDDFAWHKDAYHSFTKQQLDKFLETAPEKSKIDYAFLKNSSGF